MSKEPSDVKKLIWIIGYAGMVVVAFICSLIGKPEWYGALLDWLRALTNS